METINYDFSEIENILRSIKTSPTPINLDRLKKEINRFFNDSTCRDVLYTNNTDKLFFGMYVMPYLKGEDAVEILTADKPKRIQQYYLELDSKLFSPILNLSKEELTAVLLHEIGHIVKDTQPVEDVRKSVDSYLAENKTNLSINDSIHYREILAFAIKNTIRKFTSIFEKEDDEIIADEFVVRCGYGPQLESAYKKIVKSTGKINRDVNSKLMVLDWTLRLYKNVKFQRIGALKTLNSAKSITPSKLQKRDIDIVTQSLNKIDDDALMEAAIILEDAKKNNSLFSQIRYNGMRSLEDDVYEYNMRIKNVEDEDDALYVLRQINSRMAIIDDYLNTETDLDDKERDRWNTLYSKYSMLRDELSKKANYAQKKYGVLFSDDYNRIR